VVDERRVRRLLQRIADDVAFLRRHAAGRAQEVREDEVLSSAVKYRFVTAIEGCIDVAQHLCSSEGWGPPDDNADALRLLGRRGVLEQLLAGSMATAVGFRNVLVHEYAEVDDERVVAFIDRLADLEAFVTASAAWLETA